MAIAPAPAPTTFIERAAVWARANLFNSPLNSVLSVLILAVLAWLVPKLVAWALIDAVFRPDSAACRAATGACWGFVAEKLRLMMFGTYLNPKEDIETCGFDDVTEKKLLPLLLGREVSKS